MSELHSHTARPHTHLDWLDPIKGIAIAGVVWYHIAILLYGVPPFDHVKETWLPLADRLARMAPVPNDALATFFLVNAFRYIGWLGYQGVGLFLALSGFGLAWSQLRSGPSPEIDLRDYFLRRVWRVFPIYWAGHLFFLVFHALTGQPDVSASDPRFYLSLAGVRFLPETFYTISPAWWYVGLIVQLYVVFPLLWKALMRWGLVRFWIGTAAITLIARAAGFAFLDRHLEMWSMGAIFVTRLFEFAFGMGLAWLLARQPERTERALLRRRTIAAAAGVYALALACSFTVAGQIVAHMLIAVSLFTLTYALSRRLLTRAWPVRRASVWLGEQSYPLMILHQPILWWFIPIGLAALPSYPTFIAALMALTAIVALGSGAFGAIVEHVLAAMRRISRKEPVV